MQERNGTTSPVNATSTPRRQHARTVLRAVLGTLHGATIAAATAGTYRATAPHLPVIPLPGAPLPTAALAALGVAVLVGLAPVLTRTIRP